MKNLFETIKQKNEVRNVLITEFGVYKGFSLLWLTRYRDRYLPGAEIVAVDSFEGLPESSTIWKKGSFSDTSYESVVKTLERFTHVSDILNHNKNIKIIKGKFSEQQVSAALEDALHPAGESPDKFMLIAHIDCDLGSSATEALGALDKAGAFKTKKFFLLFDDWYNHPDEIPKAFEEFISVRSNWKVKEIFSTKLTRYFEVYVTDDVR